MDITIRHWEHRDLRPIQQTWLTFCRSAGRSDMQLKSDADTTMAEWLLDRFKRTDSFGFVAERDGAVLGFLIGRVGDWDSTPPVIESRKIGIIDAVHVEQPFRRQGIGGQLIHHALDVLREQKAVAVETIYEAWNDSSTETWHHAGFAPWMVHAYRLL